MVSRSDTRSEGNHLSALTSSSIEVVDSRRVLSNGGGMTRTQQRASERITEEVTSWAGVSAGRGERGEFAFKLGRREIGHLHGERVLHAGFPKAVWHELYAAGRIDYHPVFPGRPGYASRSLETD